MATLMTQQKKIERNKRYLFLGTGAGGLVTTLLLTPVLGVPVMALSAYFGWDWLKFRAKRGMRF